MGNPLAQQIALDRQDGTLIGPVTVKYLDKLKSDEQQTMALNQQTVKQMMGSGSIETAMELLAQRPPISFEVLDKAIGLLLE